MTHRTEEPDPEVWVGDIDTPPNQFYATQYMHWTHGQDLLKLFRVLHALHDAREKRQNLKI